MNESTSNDRTTEGDGDLRFEDSLQRLEAIVSQLEQGSLPLDRAMELYEDGLGAYKNCRRLLQRAEARVVKLVEGLEGELEEVAADLPDDA